MREIKIKDEFGCNIIKTIVENRYVKNLEIGSGDGRGSTRCFLNGMNLINASSNDKKLQCIEINVDMFKKLKESIKEDYVDFFNMSSIGKGNMIIKSFNDIWGSQYNNLSNKYTKDMVFSWYERDINNLPEKGFLSSESSLKEYDAVLIDGGEFFGYSEYMLLKGKVNCFMLDDVFGAYKCNQIYEELIRNKDWILIKENRILRNGYAIFIRKNSV